MSCSHVHSSKAASSLAVNLGRLKLKIERLLLADIVEKLDVEFAVLI